MRTVYLVTTMIFLALIGLTGCTQKGDEFIGKWERAEKKHHKNKEDSIDIKREDGVFHVTLKHWPVFDGEWSNYTVDKVQARAESDSVLSVIGGGLQTGSATFTIENGNLYTTQGVEYRRTN